ncbi:pre-mRNA-splicing factor SLU7 [Tanacetum coccineum]
MWRRTVKIMRNPQVDLEAHEHAHRSGKKKELNDNDDEDSESNFDEQENMSFKVCGLLPHFCLKGSIGLLNPVECQDQNMSVSSANRKCAASSAKSQPARVASYEHKSPVKHQKDETVCESESTEATNQLNSRKLKGTELYDRLPVLPLTSIDYIDRSNDLESASKSNSIHGQEEDKHNRQRRILVITYCIKFDEEMESRIIAYKELLTVDTFISKWFILASLTHRVTSKQVAVVAGTTQSGHQHVASTSMNNVEASSSNSRVPRISGESTRRINSSSEQPGRSGIILLSTENRRLPFPSSFPWISALNDQTLHIAPEDDKLLQEDVSATPVKKDGLNGKERPKYIGMSWLVKTQYISPLSTDAARQSLGRLNPVRNTGRKQKELQEARKAGLAPVEVDEDGKEINPHIRQYILVKPFYLQLKPESPSLKHQKNWKSNSSNTKSWYDRGVRILQAHKHMKGACAQVKFSCSFKPFGELYNN